MNKKIYTYDLLVSYGLFNIEIKNYLLAKKLFIFSIKKILLLFPILPIFSLINKATTSLKSNLETNNKIFKLVLSTR